MDVVMVSGASPRPLRVLILNQAFWPDVVSSGQHAADLATGLAARGHDVCVIASARGYDNPGVRFSRREVWNGVRIRRVAGLGLGKAARWRRAADFASFMAGCALAVAPMPRFDVVVAMTSPPLISWLARWSVPWKASRLVVWALDLNPDEAIAAGWLGERSLAGRLLSGMLRSSLRKAQTVVALDRFMKERIAAKDVPGARIAVIPPWAQDDVVRFDPAGRADFRRRHQLDGKFVVMYSGNHSPCHPLDTLVQAAEALRARDDVVFCFVGGGSEHGKIRELAAARRLENIRCLPYQPLQQLAASLSAADLHVVVMGDPFRGIVHPCKIYNILAVGAPVLYIGPAESHVTDLARNLPQHWCARVGHGDVGQVIEQVQSRAAAPAAGMRISEAPLGCSKRELLPRLIAVVEQTSVIADSLDGTERWQQTSDSAELNQPSRTTDNLTRMERHALCSGEAAN